MLTIRHLAVLGLGALVACTSQEDMTLLHREITDVQRQVQRMETACLDRNDLSDLQTKLSDQGEGIVRSNADLAQKVTRLQEQIEVLQADLEITTRRLENISEQLVTLTEARHRSGIGTVVTGDASPEEGPRNGGGMDTAADSEPSDEATPMTPEALYRSASNDYRRGSFDLAAQGFEEYVSRYPDTERTDNAVYWTGECHAALDRPEEAIAAFTKLLDEYPASDKAAAAQLKKGMLLLEMGEQGQGVINLQYVVYEHPGTKEADIAREKLRSLGITIR